jgi:hypothetical protein
MRPVQYDPSTTAYPDERALIGEDNPIYSRLRNAVEAGREPGVVPHYGLGALVHVYDSQVRSLTPWIVADIFFSWKIQRPIYELANGSSRIRVREELLHPEAPNETDGSPAVDPPAPEQDPPRGP